MSFLWQAALAFIVWSMVKSIGNLEKDFIVVFSKNTLSKILCVNMDEYFSNSKDYCDTTLIIIWIVES